jgi:hypothetical protein
MVRLAVVDRLISSNFFRMGLGNVAGVENTFTPLIAHLMPFSCSLSCVNDSINSGFYF